MPFKNNTDNMILTMDCVSNGDERTFDKFTYDFDTDSLGHTTKATNDYTGITTYQGTHIVGPSTGNLKYKVDACGQKAVDYWISCENNNEVLKKNRDSFYKFISMSTDSIGTVWKADEETGMMLLLKDYLSDRQQSYDALIKKAKASTSDAEKVELYKKADAIKIESAMFKSENVNENNQQFLKFIFEGQKDYSVSDNKLIQLLKLLDDETLQNLGLAQKIKSLSDLDSSEFTINSSNSMRLNYDILDKIKTLDGLKLSKLKTAIQQQIKLEEQKLSIAQKKLFDIITSSKHFFKKFKEYQQSNVKQRYDDYCSLHQNYIKKVLAREPTIEPTYMASDADIDFLNNETGSEIDKATIELINNSFDKNIQKFVCDIYNFYLYLVDAGIVIGNDTKLMKNNPRFRSQFQKGKISLEEIELLKMSYKEIMAVEQEFENITIKIIVLNNMNDYFINDDEKHTHFKQDLKTTKSEMKHRFDYVYDLALPEKQVLDKYDNETQFFRSIEAKYSDFQFSNQPESVDYIINHPIYNWRKNLLSALARIRNVKKYLIGLNGANSSMYELVLKQLNKDNQTLDKRLARSKATGRNQIIFKVFLNDKRTEYILCTLSGYEKDEELETVTNEDEYL